MTTTQQLILTIGLPASGKSTWAKEYTSNNPNFINICKDDIRPLFKSQGKNEGDVIKERDKLTIEALDAGKSVIWSDTNFNPIHFGKAVEIASNYETRGMVITKVFDTPLKECIKRDNARANGVGETVIKRMYNQYVRPKAVKPKYNGTLPDCYIFDIDGTLAEMGDRSPFDWKKVGLDTLKKDVSNIIDMIITDKYDSSRTNDIIIMSGRDSVCRPETEQWLADNHIGYNNLYMRPQGDIRSDDVVKKELYETHINGKYNVLGVFDDRDSVVALWRSLGLTCFQVAEGDF
jgi:predicted kinase